MAFARSAIDRDDFAMKLRSPRAWGITARLITVAAVPLCLMFLLINSWFYWSGQSEVTRRIDERGQLIVQAMAETSQYGVVTGNLSYVERNARHLVASDKRVAAIQILDAQRRVLVSTGAPTHGDGLEPFEAPIRADVPDINLFDQLGAPHVALSSDTPTPFRAGKIAGYVRVLMSPHPIVQERRQRLYLGAAVTLVATLISVCWGLYLIRGLSAPLRAVMAALRQLRLGRYDVRLSPHAGGELGELQSAISEMAEALSLTHQELERKVADRTQALQQAIAATQEADAEKRRLIAHSNTLLEEERERIAVEIHDHLNASLLVVSMEAQHIAALASQPTSHAAHQEIQRVAQRMTGTIQGLYGAARNLVKQLRPEVIDTLGLRGALEEMVRNYDELHPACRFTLTVAPSFPYLSGQLAITAYRLVQEALSNVVKHAHASQADVRLEKHARADTISISIADNGTGFDPSQRHGDGIGLIGMRERVAALGGVMAVHSNALGGTAVDIQLPAHEVS